MKPFFVGEKTFVFFVFFLGKSILTVGNVNVLYGQSGLSNECIMTVWNKLSTEPAYGCQPYGCKGKAVIVLSQTTPFYVSASGSDGEPVLMCRFGFNYDFFALRFGIYTFSFFQFIELSL